MIITSTYCDAIGAAQVINGTLHIAFCVTQPDIMGGMERIVVARLMMPVSVVESCRTAVDKAVAAEDQDLSLRTFILNN
jgi:hypothetical protein